MDPLTALVVFVAASAPYVALAASEKDDKGKGKDKDKDKDKDEGNYGGFWG